VFCGRILLFLAKFFPFSERSGLNVVSEFNLENTTLFSSADEASDANGAISGTEEMEVDSGGVKIEPDQRK
jgi:THO complex subunit 1